MGPGALSSRIDRALRSTTAVVTVVVALCSAALSYSGLYRLSIDAGVDPTLALLVPLCIDGLIVVGAMTTLHATICEQNTAYGWMMTGIGVVLSVYGNAASVTTGTGWELWQARTVHAIAPISLALCIEGFMMIVRRRAGDLIAEEKERLRREASAARRSAPNGKARRNGKTKSEPLSEAVLAEARRMQEQGKSFGQIAAELPQRSRTGWHRILTS
ncbi:DUF2637 domain-containing protein [Aeromicrobium sp. CTD01-1L150]|uniref:DUF2637 domain-containing protein n=1 Tax=Aeromicrobium sp. CTD01-1L150 TaxID=3341830 RepID=UPI0035C1B9CF